MGHQQVKEIASLADQQLYLSHLLDDIEAIEVMLTEGMFEKGVSRVGAEQELCLVNKNFRPAKTALKILDRIEDPHFTTELALFNLEINLDPVLLNGATFTILEKQLQHLLKLLRKEAEKVEETKIILTGILPTIRKGDLVFDNITPFQRYKTLNDILRRIRGDDFKLQIKGVDELILKHDTILFEACNTSFQIHLQIDPREIVEKYNWAQMIAGPVLAASSNSPLLLGRDLWSETRIALFQQSLDYRNPSYHAREQKARVSFGSMWIKDSILELYRDDIARYKPLITTDFDSNATDELKAGKIPKLRALNIFNGTIYKWNRLCYGATGNVPHFRIENRYIPSGPSIRDEVANAVFWIGLMNGMPEKYTRLYDKIPFSNAKWNFINAASTGINSYFKWFDRNISAKELILDELIPIARKGLRKAAVDEKDIRKYLKVIRKRVDSRITGSIWQIRSYKKLRESQTRDIASMNLTACMYKNQLSNKPVYKWKLNPDDYLDIDLKKIKLEKMMSTELFVVDENDLVLLVDRVMRWKNISHIPVVDKNNRLKGIISKSNIKDLDLEKNKLLVVKDYMVKDLITVGPKVTVLEARNKMIENHIGCLPVLEKGNLIGILTKSDILKIFNASQSENGAK